MWSTFSRQLPSLLLFTAGALTAFALVTGRLRLEWRSGRVVAHVRARGDRVRVLSIPVQFAEGWLVVALVLVIQWATAETILRSEWIPGGLGPIVSLALLGGLAGLVLAKSPLNAPAYVLAGLELGFLALVLMTASMTLGGAGPHPPWQFWWPLQPWLAQFWRSTTWGAQMGLLASVWLTGLWTSWWTFRQRRGLVALVPSGAIIAVDVLNDPTHGVLNFLVIVWLAAAMGLLLRLHYVGLARRWRERRIPRAADTGWHFGEIGFEATSALIIVSFLLPPLNQQDLSSILVPPDLSIANFGRSIGLGTGGSGGRGGKVETGFTTNVRPWGPIKRTNKVVFEASGPDTAQVLYWEGAALGGYDGQEWYLLTSADDLTVGVEGHHPAGKTIAMVESETQLTLQKTVTTTMTVLQPHLLTLFGGGVLRRVDGVAAAVRGLTPEARGARPTRDVVPVGGRGARTPFATVDEVSVPSGTKIPAKYVATAVVTNADIQSLQAAGTSYPDWVKPFTRLYTRGGPRTQADRRNDEAIARLARQVVSAAGAVTAYDQAKAIESFLRRTDGPQSGPLNERPFIYDLETASPLGDARAVDYFLLQTHRGYCEYFASSMGVMLRSLGIPARLVSGFGKGGFVEARGYRVRGQDAHTWVEVYFPRFGWVEFEPTPDPNYPPIERPVAANVDANGGDELASPVGGGTGRDVREPDEGVDDSGTGGAGIGLAARRWYLPALLLAALALLGAILLRLYLRVHDVRRIWRRVLVLGERYQVPARPGDTPLEFGERLARAVPSVGAAVRDLARLYTRHRFRRGGLTGAEEGQLQVAWAEVRRRYAVLLWQSVRRPQTAEFRTGG